MHLFLDVSRLLTCGRKPAPSGIDRVEFAYARRWSGEGAAASPSVAPPGPVTFVASAGLGRFAAIGAGAVRELVAGLAAAWAGGPEAAAAARHARRLAEHWRARLLLGRDIVPAIRRARDPVFLLVSHRFLERREALARLRGAGAAFVPLIHDLIPLTHPEYARPGQPEKHGRRIASAAALSDAVIVNSAATEAAFAPWLAAAGRLGPAAPPVLVAPLGIEPGAPPHVEGARPGEHAAEALCAVDAAPDAARPYFVALGTIEPRKNHMLLLHLWREFAARLGPAAPRLVLIGRRGWENENVVDLLDRCAALRGLVEERGGIPDDLAVRLVAGARALLFPSFAEGYGLPLAEALALGVPALCSDLPALREVGGEVPDYLDPLDGPGWRRAILDYAMPGSPARTAQLARLPGWSAPRWDSHFVGVDALLPLALERRRAAAQATDPTRKLHAVVQRRPPLAALQRDMP
ncbi:glycosyltransferase family 4 protein [Roseomonas sp. NAR14]|uniref:Glycosyltransferase family 4 protein n=1 Tax=Roseomonas acroporae TaxID=2937791 RepID=A0A9X1Y9U6_9PROT|nr:glycosyltransferase family 1 protein [Roseomonas acroporae]MCK8785797.1 glycosyltransferase family 4 protein [Roseomonas acroporae]